MLNKVFFIDDDHVALILNRKLVEKTAFAEETITASNGKEAMEYLTLLRDSEEVLYPSLIFVDLNMPVMDGWEFLEEFSRSLFSEFPLTKIIILSSSINPEDLKRSKQYPMVIEFISKPVTQETLERLRLTLSEK